MRKPLLAGNWKMNKTITETMAFADAFIKEVGNVKDKDILLCPPFTALAALATKCKGTSINIGAQNCSYAESGAYTGEVSPNMIIEAGCSHVIIGHSERRKLFGETDAVINKKTNLALSKGLNVILCVGETLEEREANKTFSVLETQITAAPPATLTSAARSSASCRWSTAPSFLSMPPKGRCRRPSSWSARR